MDSSLLRKEARDALAGKWGIAVIGGLIASIFISDRSSSLVSVVDSLLEVRGESDFDFSALLNELLYGSLRAALYASIIVSLVLFVIRGAIRLGYCNFNMDIVENKDPQLGTIFSKFSMFGKAFLLELLTALMVTLMLCLLIIPGIIASYSLAMAPYIMADNPDITATEALKRSRKMMNGHKLDLFILHLSFIGWAILCGFTCGIGTLWLNPYRNTADAVFYLKLREEMEE